MNEMDATTVARALGMDSVITAIHLIIRMLEQLVVVCGLRKFTRRRNGRRRDDSIR